MVQSCSIVCTACDGGVYLHAASSMLHFYSFVLLMAPTGFPQSHHCHFVLSQSSIIMSFGIVSCFSLVFFFLFVFFRNEGSFFISEELSLQVSTIASHAFTLPLFSSLLWLNKQTHYQTKCVSLPHRIWGRKISHLIQGSHFRG